MRYFIFGFLLFLQFSIYSQEKIFDANTLIIEGEKIITQASLRIENPDEADCTYDLGDFIIKHYLDADGRLVKTVKKNIIAAASILGAPTIEIFDFKGNLVLRKKQDYHSGEIYFLTLFKYNSYNLIAEEFHLSIYNIYRLVHKNNSNYKENKKIYYNSDGKKVRSIKRTKKRDIKKI